MWEFDVELLFLACVVKQGKCFREIVRVMKRRHRQFLTVFSFFIFAFWLSIFRLDLLPMKDITQNPTILVRDRKKTPKTLAPEIDVGEYGKLSSENTPRILWEKSPNTLSMTHSHLAVRWAENKFFYTKMPERTRIESIRSLLTVVSDVFSRHQIEYWIAFGTLLGDYKLFDVVW